MKKLKFISIALAVALLVFSACNKDNGKEPKEPECKTVTDACGNTYPIVKIGNQYWMAENLKCDKYDTQSEAYKDGIYTIKEGAHTYLSADPFYTDASDRSKWNLYSQSFSVNLTDSQVGKLGYLYDWSATVGVANGQKQTTAFSGNRQGICPNEWHIPSKAEWQTLYDYIYRAQGLSSNEVGWHLKTTSGWYNSGNGLDTYSFAALPAGYAYGSVVSHIGYLNYFWTATPFERSIIRAHYYYIDYQSDKLDSEDILEKNIGISVRCVKD